MSWDNSAMINKGGECVSRIGEQMGEHRSIG